MIMLYSRPGQRVLVNSRGDMIVRPSWVEASLQRLPGGTAPLDSLRQLELAHSLVYWQNMAFWYGNCQSCNSGITYHSSLYHTCLCHHVYMANVYTAWHVHPHHGLYTHSHIHHGIGILPCAYTPWHVHTHHGTHQSMCLHTIAFAYPSY